LKFPETREKDAPVPGIVSRGRIWSEFLGIFTKSRSEFRFRGARSKRRWVSASTCASWNGRLAPGNGQRIG